MRGRWSAIAPPPTIWCRTAWSGPSAIGASGAKATPRPWLFTILHNLAVNQFRRSARRGKHIAIDEASEDDFGQDAVQEQKLMYQDVLDKLARLPEDQRAVLLLVAVEDLSYADAARVLDIPVGTVMSRLSRAREKLQQEIEGTADGAPKNVVQLRSMK